MADDDRTCEQLADRIADLEQFIERLRDLLDSEPDLSESTRRLVRRQISASQGQLGALRQELVACRLPLVIAGVEVTQGIQFFAFNGQGSGSAPDNSLPLVAQRATVLRVYADHKGAGRQGPQPLPLYVTGRVVVDRLIPGGAVQRVATLQPINGPIVARAGDTIDRGEADHTLNFRLRAPDSQGLLRFTVTVFEQGPVVGGTAAAAITHTVTVQHRFEPVPAFRVHGVLVHYTGDGMDLPAPSGFALAKTLEYVLRTYPIGRLEFDDCTEIDFALNLRTPGGGCGPGFEGPGGLMEILRRFDDLSDRPAIHVGLIPKGARMSVGGCGNRNIAAAKDGASTTLAQEIGHALDRRHAPSGGAPGADPDYPQYGTYPPGSIGEYGFDVVTSDVYDPNVSVDFMGYGAGPRWISPYTFAGIRDVMVERFGDPGGTGRTTRFSSPVPEEPREILFLAFRVLRSGEVELRPSFHLPRRVPDRRPGHPETSPGDVSCELLDPAGEVLAFHRCAARGSQVDPAGPYLDFHEAIRWSDDAAVLRILRGGEILATHEIEPAAPSLTMAAPPKKGARSTRRLAWTGDHPRNAVTYAVRYSHDDGATWQLVAPSLDIAEYDLPVTALAGGESCLWQVLATSGIRTSVAVSQPVRMPSKPRSAAILTPDPMSPAGPSGRVGLLGGAFSPDFGLAAPEDVVWSSTVDGFLGRGVEMSTDGLSPGWHVITLTAPDGLGGTVTATSSLRVAPR